MNSSKSPESKYQYIYNRIKGNKSIIIADKTDMPWQAFIQLTLDLNLELFMKA